MANNRKILISIFLVTFIIRIIAACVYLNFDAHALTMHKPFLPWGEDSKNVFSSIRGQDGYNRWAYDILTKGEILRESHRDPLSPPPLYPLFLAFCYLVFGFNIFAFFIPQITLASINSILIFFLAQRLFSAKVAILASLFYCLNPHFILNSIQLFSETLYFFLLLSIFLLCQKLTIRPLVKYLVYLGGLMALAALCRSVFLVFVPFVFIWLIIVFYRKRPKMLIALFLVCLSFLSIYGVWLIKNYKTYHQFLLFVPRVVQIDGSRTQAVNGTVEYRDSYKEGVINFIIGVEKDPKWHFSGWKSRLKTFLFAPCVEGVSLRHQVVSSFLLFSLYPLGYLGLARAIRERGKTAILALLFIGSATIFHTFAWIDGELRYRLPVELFMTIFAAYGLGIILDLVWYRKV